MGRVLVTLNAQKGFADKHVLIDEPLQRFGD